MVVPYRRWPRAGAVFHGMLRRAEKLTAARAHELGIVAALADDQAALIERAIAEVQALAGAPARHRRRRRRHPAARRGRIRRGQRDGTQPDRDRA